MIVREGCAPNVNVVVKVSDYLEDTVVRVTRGEIDFLACVGEYDIQGSFATFAKKRAPLVFVTHPDNPVLSRKKLRIEDVIRSSFIVSGYIERGELAVPNVPGIDIELYSYFIYSKDRWINPVMSEFIRIASE